MPTDKSTIIGKDGNTAVYDKDGVLSQMLIDGKVWNVSVSAADRQTIRDKK